MAPEAPDHVLVALDVTADQLEREPCAGAPVVASTGRIGHGEEPEARQEHELDAVGGRDAERGVQCRGLERGGLADHALQRRERLGDGASARARSVATTLRPTTTNN